jgi:isocitrate dehydrogenase
VTTRKTFGLYANVRPCVSYAPYVKTKHPEMDIVIIRENEEDLYAGIEHRQTNQVYQTLKLISHPGSEKIARYAFEYAKAYGRKKVTCFTKDNIMKMTDGIFHKVFDEVGEEYPDIEKEHWIVDIGAAKMANTPEKFDVILLPNLYGDILSDVAAEIAGSVGLAGSANIGEGCAMFEAIHGSAPRRAGQNLANPSGLFLGAVQMLVHIGQIDVAERAHNAWLKTLEDGVHTYDLYDESISTQKVGTKEFAQAVIERLGQLPEKLKPVSYTTAPKIPTITAAKKAASTKELVGVDVFIDYPPVNPDELGEKLKAVKSTLEFQYLSNRGMKVWPDVVTDTMLVDHWRARYMASNGTQAKNELVVEVLDALAKAGIDFIKTEHLYDFDGKPAYSA